MDLRNGLHSLLGGEPPSVRQKGELRSGTSAALSSGLRKESNRLKEELNIARERIAQLEKQIERMEEETTAVEQNINTQREDIDQLITGVSVQIQEMIDSLNQQMEQLDFKTQSQISELQGTSDQLESISESTQQISEIRGMIENLEQQKVSLDEINEKSEGLKEELFEKIHTENVACYRNMKSLVTELHENVSDMEISEDSLTQIRKSFKGIKIMSVFSVCSFGVLVFFLLMVFDVISIFESGSGGKRERGYWRPGNMLYPVPAVMVSCMRPSERPNIITIAWAGTICSDPVMLSISVRKERYSHDIIEETKEFVVNLVTEELTRAADYCGVKSGRDVDKFEKMHLTPSRSETVKAPGIMESPVSLECRVKERIELGSHDMYLAEVTAVSVNPEYMDENGKFCLNDTGLVAYSHGEYFKLGERIGSFGYSVKKKKK